MSHCRTRGNEYTNRGDDGHTIERYPIFFCVENKTRAVRLRTPVVHANPSPPCSVPPQTIVGPVRTFPVRFETWNRVRCYSRFDSETTIEEPFDCDAVPVVGLLYYHCSPSLSSSSVFVLFLTGGHTIDGTNRSNSSGHKNTRTRRPSHRTPQYPVPAGC